MKGKKAGHNNYSIIIRKSPVILVIRLLAAELLILTLNLILRLPALFIELEGIAFNFISLYFILVILIQLINLYLIVTIVLQWINEYYILNPKEVIVHSGIFSINETTYEFANLQSMTISQSFFERLFNYGTIKLYNPVLKQEVYLHQIPNPKKYGEIIQIHPPDASSPMRRVKSTVF